MGENFKVVSDDLRGAAWRGRRGNPDLAPLLEGKTLLLPEPPRGNRASILKPKGLRQRQRRTPEGWVVWIEKIEASDVP